jgi:phosphoribosylaminoimidazolecarboxamide formyltransferase/IMP cyclohydrolase
MAKIKRALMSVYDKTGLIPFARALRKQKIEILSTGGTLKALRDAAIPARSVSEFTGFPEILEGRVKTLHPKIHGGLLFRRNRAGDRREAKKHGILPIDMVVVNLYPFGDVIQKKGVTFDAAIENIDVGGPTMLRAAAKNFESVVVITDPADYEPVLREMEKGSVSVKTRARLAQKVFDKTSSYDRIIGDYLEQVDGARSPRPHRMRSVDRWIRTH